MKIAVLCKSAPAVVSEVEIASGGRSLQFQGQSLTMNESDEYALAEAIALKRAHGGEVTVLTMGSIITQDILYLSLAKGADKVIRIDARIQDSRAAGMVLAAALGRLEYDLVLTGTQSRDTLSGQVGIAIAGNLGLPFAFAVAQVEVEGNQSIKVLKELGGGRYARVRLPLPALLCIQTGIQPLTYVPPARMQRARQQPVRSLSLEDLGFMEEQVMPQGYRYLQVFPPRRLGQVKFLEGSPSRVAAELLAKIKEVM